MIIPIGVDCGMAEFCRKHNLRTTAFPFDWTVTYNGVSKCIEDNFKLFTEPLTNKINEYDVSFVHDFENAKDYDKYKEKYNRRYKRLINTLETSGERIIFCRKGHACRHHSEHNGKYSKITSDIVDAEKLDAIISYRYPQLNYKIIVILVCGECFNTTCEYKSNSNNIEIYNIATSQLEDKAFEDLCRSILL
jgi:hypothetical protein